MSPIEQRNILVFDSGLGGLSLIPEIRKYLPGRSILYMADNALFPYGDLSEEDLSARLVLLFQKLHAHCDISTAVIACNTASTVTLDVLRGNFPISFVGTVPAIKPAAQMSKTGLISVLATPGTVSRGYTQKLIDDFAGGVDVSLHGSAELAKMAEDKLGGMPVNLEQLHNEIKPAFRDNNGRRTDVVVLGCTHYPLLKEEMSALAPWPVTFLDTSEAIARRLRDISGPCEDVIGQSPDRVILTKENNDLAHVFSAFDFQEIDILSV